VLKVLVSSLTILVLHGIAADAQDWNVRPWDTRLTTGETRLHLEGNSVEFPDGGIAMYEPGGGYTYTYRNGNRFDGRWELTGDGVVCTSFPGGESRCDLYVLQGDRLMLISERGGRFLATR